MVDTDIHKTDSPQCSGREGEKSRLGALGWVGGHPDQEEERGPGGSVRRGLISATSNAASALSDTSQE